MNPIPPYGRSSSISRDIGRRVEKLAMKVKEKTSGNNEPLIGSKKPESLNKKLSYLDVSKSSSGWIDRLRKRALLIGVTYKTWEHRLKGTVNDVRGMRELLITILVSRRTTSLFLQARGVICSKCRQRLSILTTNSAQVKCPTCNTMNPIPEYGRSSSKDRGKRCHVEKLAMKVKEKISGNNEPVVDSKKPKSLNKKPSYLDFPKSSSGRIDQPRKRALLIGVTYRRWKHRLKGTVNDVTRMRGLLISNFGFQEDNILVLTEQETIPDLIPTKKNILKSLDWLVKDPRAGDSLVFYFSGHGLRQPDFEQDERDGFDETICPVDFIEEGMIHDNDINSTIVWPLQKDVTLHSIVDACHSGTILDLVHVYNRQLKKWEDNSPPSGNRRKHTNGGLAISLSACQDDQVAAEIFAFSEKQMNGALTYVLIDILTKFDRVTYGDLLDLMHEKLEEANQSGSLLAKMLRKLLNVKFV